ncbi:MAG: ribose 5-phosphate isomerase B [Propioniciclava sp.]
MKITISSDHTGFELRHELAEEARELGYEVTDVGPADSVRSDYPDEGARVGRLVASGEADLGIIVCGTGVGISLAANRVPGIRAVVCSDTFTAEYARRHNNTNVLALGARVVAAGLGRQIVRAWLTAPVEGGRHAERVAMLDEISAGTR